MKKKVLVVALAVALLAIAVGGSLAWFMDTDEAKNTFTVGSVDIEQIEEFEPNSQLIPVVGTDPTDTDDNYITKNVTVKNTGINGAYVQTYVAVPQVLDENNIVKLYPDYPASNGWTAVDGDEAVDGIQPMYTGVKVKEEKLLYNLYLFRYDSELASGVTTNACLEYVYIDKEVDINTYDDDDNQETDRAHFVVKDATATSGEKEITEFDATGELNIYVATQGVQARGFKATATKTAVEVALESAFATHPWAE